MAQGQKKKSELKSYVRIVENKPKTRNEKASEKRFPGAIPDCNNAFEERNLEAMAH